jgi:hypothetical protein
MVRVARWRDVQVFTGLEIGDWGLPSAVCDGRPLRRLQLLPKGGSLSVDGGQQRCAQKAVNGFGSGPANQGLVKVSGLAPS